MQQNLKFILVILDKRKIIWNCWVLCVFKETHLLWPSPMLPHLQQCIFKYWRSRYSATKHLVPTKFTDTAIYLILRLQAWRLCFHDIMPPEIFECNIVALQMHSTNALEMHLCTLTFYSHLPAIYLKQPNSDNRLQSTYTTRPRHSERFSLDFPLFIFFLSMIKYWLHYVCNCKLDTKHGMLRCKVPYVIWHSRTLAHHWKS